MTGKTWYKARGYLHLTPRLNAKEDFTWLKRYVSNPDQVERHAFFPLLHKKIDQRRYKVVDHKDGHLIRGHTKQSKKGVLEPTKKVRPIHYAAHLDAQIYAYYAQEKIQKPYELRLLKNPGLSECISAYRKISTGIGKACKNNIHFAKDVFDFIKGRQEGCCALAFDIESFFNSLDHKILKKAWYNLLETQSLPPDHYNIFKSVTKYRYIMLNDLRMRPGDKRSPFDEKHLAKLRGKGIHAFFERANDIREELQNGNLPVYYNQTLNNEPKQKIMGIPQGLPISATLANLYLYEFDKLIYEKIVLESGGFYRRYSDDIVVICDEPDSESTKSFVEKTILQFKLSIASSKTEVCFFRPEHIEDVVKLIPYALNKYSNSFQQGAPFRYLGFEFYGDHALIKSSNLSKFYRRMKSAVKTRIKRMQHWQEENIESHPILHKRKLYRMFTRMGHRTKRILGWSSFLRYDKITRKWIPTRVLSRKRYRGNVLTYAWRAAEIMKEPPIKRQFRRCSSILKNLLRNVEQT